ncbi:MAG: hypothetical protein KJ904_05550 [Alphaproteobacteria bacterium]|nr:hypothetical protein [Alphaproteobacteria bacterium]MBU0797601.1 hypothetical protein [Alphaproteobacteria bacterium]MBU0886611.1 hypothetical protein [Alphaproteobacteria bacterium]MBU1812584.1 hypothetical protein [Alphaproteobacteria bacterium]MBU2090349.1 hypothetical protein [Alphaproteobacteria bacterium]
MKKAEIDGSQRAGVTTNTAERLKSLERENRELRQASEILRKASAYPRPAAAAIEAGQKSDQYSNAPQGSPVVAVNETGTQNAMPTIAIRIA